MSPMRRIALIVCLGVLTAGAVRPAAAQRTPATLDKVPRPATAERLDRLERWLKLVARHEPGEIDPELEEVASWSNASLQDLWTDAFVLVKLARLGHKGDFRFTQVHYAREQALRMSALSCAADGAIFEDACVAILAMEPIDDDLRRLAVLAHAANLRGDRNYIVRRGALLHSDVGMLSPASMDAPFDGRLTTGPQSYRMEISDGQDLGLHQNAANWEIACMLLDFVVPKGLDRAAPERDAMVREWYRATAAWMQLREDHNEMHITRALRIFPTDPDLLFLAACQKEAFAGAAIQAAVRSAVLPFGVTMGVSSPQTELREAEQFLRRALQAKVDFAEARLRYGRVLGQLGRHAEAAIELRRAVTGLTDVEQMYFAELFLGTEEEALGNRDTARLSYEHAAERFPRAQSPLVSLSQLARRAGDRAGALRAMDRVFALTEDERRETDDPWWRYYLVQARNADDLLEALRQPYRAERLQ